MCNPDGAFHSLSPSEKSRKAWLLLLKLVLPWLLGVVAIIVGKVVVEVACRECNDEKAAAVAAPAVGYDRIAIILLATAGVEDSQAVDARIMTAAANKDGFQIDECLCTFQK
mmetsp:Transcript_20190/g.26030  ORF Transcript_20190/g.26030 Transcript_20190/m.26030 type:complete len:112 (+) Transcript_20190:121-456(+)